MYFTNGNLASSVNFKAKDDKSMYSGTAAATNGYCFIINTSYEINWLCWIVYKNTLLISFEKIRKFEWPIFMHTTKRENRYNLLLYPSQKANMYFHFLLRSHSDTVNSNLMKKNHFEVRNKPSNK